MSRPVEIEERFWEKVDWDLDDTERCWPWLAGTSHGYGRFGFGLTDGTRFTADAHRVAYELATGAPPDGIVDHTCHDPAFCKLSEDCLHRACQNPHHMKIGTRADNTAPGRVWRWQDDKTHCPAGHPYSEGNTYRYGGARQCRECRRARGREYDARRRPPRAR